MTIHLPDVRDRMKVLGWEDGHSDVVIKDINQFRNACKALHGNLHETSFYDPETQTLKITQVCVINIPIKEVSKWSEKSTAAIEVSNGVGSATFTVTCPMDRKCTNSTSTSVVGGELKVLKIDEFKLLEPGKYTFIYREKFTDKQPVSAVVVKETLISKEDIKNTITTLLYPRD